MADESQLPGVGPVTLAPGIGENNEIPSLDPVRYTQQQQIDYADAQEAAKQQKQAEDQNSLYDAASPTPLGKPTTPPISETLSNLGKAEPAQVGEASVALDGNQVPQQPQASQTLSTQGTPAAQIAPNGQASQASQAAQALPGSDMLAQVQKSYGQQEAANVSIAKAVQDKATADQMQFANAEAAIAKSEKERQETKLKFDATFDGRMQDFQKSIDDYKEAAGEKVMPGRILADMSTGQKIQTGIFMALSAYGSAISGQDNQALKVITNAIDSDLNAQKFNVENKLKAARAGMDGSQYILTQMKEKFKDDESAILASRMAMIAMTQQQLNANASKLDGATAGPKALALNAGLELTKTQVAQQLKQAQAQQFILSQLGSQGGANNGKPGYVDPAALDVMKRSGGEMKDQAESYVPGYGMSSGGIKDKEKFQEELKFKEPVLEAMDRVRQLKEGFSKVADPGKKAQIESEIANIKAKLKQGGLLHTNRFQPEILDFLNDFIGKPTSFTSFDTLQMKRFEQAYNAIQSDIDSAAKQNGYLNVPPRNFNASKYEQLKKSRSK